MTTLTILSRASGRMAPIVVLLGLCACPGAEVQDVGVLDKGHSTTDAAGTDAAGTDAAGTDAAGTDAEGGDATFADRLLGDTRSVDRHGGLDAAPQDAGQADADRSDLGAGDLALTDDSGANPDAAHQVADASTPFDGAAVDSAGPSFDAHTAIDATATNDAALPPLGEVQVAVTALTSSSATLSWGALDEATAVRVYLGSEPPATEGAALPVERLVAELEGSATQATLPALAAASDVFVRVEAASAVHPQQGYAYLHTLGGPRAPLDTALREVHGVGPSLLELVLANPLVDYNGGSVVGDTGTAWQGGSWSVTRHDDSAITVLAVYRRSIPVGQPDYPVGYDVYGDGDIVDVDHHLVLELAQPIGACEVLRVTHTGDGGTGLDVLVPFSDRYTVTTSLQVNQVGYHPGASERYAYVSGYLGSGGALDLSDFPAQADVLREPLDLLRPRQPVLTELAVELRAQADTDSGGEVRQIDLAALPAEEGVRYRVRLPGVGVSWPTAVSHEAVFRAFWTYWRGLFHNRWCGDLDPAYTEWSRPEDHCAASFVEGVNPGPDMFSRDDLPATDDERPVRGGHHDAGDWDIRPYHVVVGQYLMRAFERAPELFPDGQLHIPESGNGIPDVLDEALWNIAAWVQLQNTDGSVRSGVESNYHPRGYHFASDDELSYWTFDPAVWHTAYVAGLLAQGARLVAPYNSVGAEALTAAAVAAYTWAKAEGAPDEYLLYGASELYRRTGQSGYRVDFETYWAAIDDWGRGAFDNMQPMTSVYPGAFTSYTPAMPDFVMAYVGATGASQAIVDTTRAELTTRADAAATRTIDSEHAHRNGRAQNPDWGHMTVTGRQVDMIYQRLQLGGLDAERTQRYLDALSLAADYALGCNPAGYVYTTGLGSRHPEEPLHTDSLAFIKDRDMPPVPGIPVYGPVQGYPGAYYYDATEAMFAPAFDEQPLGWHLADTRTTVNMSEFTVWESQAPMAVLFAYLVEPTELPPATWLPGGALHRATLPAHSR